MADHDSSTEDPRDLADETRGSAPGAPSQSNSEDGGSTHDRRLDDLVADMAQHFDSARAKLADSSAALMSWVETTKTRFAEDQAAQQSAEAPEAPSSSSSDSTSSATLREAVGNLDEADSQAELLSRLLEQCQRFCGRTALLLGSSPGSDEEDDKSLKVWNAIGFGDQDINGQSVPCPSQWAPVLSAETTLLLTGGDAAALCEALESPAPTESLAVPFILRDSAYAILYADNLPAEGESQGAAESESINFDVDAIQLLGFVASQSMECLTLRSIRPSATLASTAVQDSSEEASADQEDPAIQEEAGETAETESQGVTSDDLESAQESVSEPEYSGPEDSVAEDSALEDSALEQGDLEQSDPEEGPVESHPVEAGDIERDHAEGAVEFVDVADAPPESSLTPEAEPVTDPDEIEISEGAVGAFETPSEPAPDTPATTSWALTPEPEAAPSQQADEPSSAAQEDALLSTPDLPPTPMGFEPSSSGWDTNQANSFVSAIEEPAEDSEPGPVPPIPQATAAPAGDAGIPPLPEIDDPEIDEAKIDEARTDEANPEVVEFSSEEFTTTPSTESRTSDASSPDSTQDDLSDESGSGALDSATPDATPDAPVQDSAAASPPTRLGSSAVPPLPGTPDSSGQNPAATQVVDAQRMAPLSGSSPAPGDLSNDATEPPRPQAFDSLSTSSPPAPSAAPIPSAPVQPTPPAEPTPPAPANVRPEAPSTPERRQHSRPPASAEVQPPADLDGPGKAFKVNTPEGEDPRLDEARRLARLLVSELKLYNEEEITRGRRLGNIYQSLREDIDRSRRIYDERVHQEVRDTADFLHEELVRGLANGDPNLLGL